MARRAATRLTASGAEHARHAEHPTQLRLGASGLGLENLDGLGFIHQAIGALSHLLNGNRTSRKESASFKNASVCRACRRIL